MAVQFKNNIPGQYLNYGIGLSGQLTTNFSITIYGGTQPSAATVASTWSSYRNTYLFHSQNNQFSTPSPTVVGPKTLQMTSSSNGTALNSGTATWAIFWATSLTDAQVQAASIPASAQFILFPVSIIGGNGIIQLASTSITSGSSYNITVFSLAAIGGIS